MGQVKYNPTTHECWITDGRGKTEYVPKPILILEETDGAVLLHRSDGPVEAVCVVHSLQEIKNLFFGLGLEDFITIKKYEEKENE